MDNFPGRYPPLFVFACLTLIAGLIGTAATLYLHPLASTYRSLLLAALGCIVFGVGELLNHPARRLPDESRALYRRRIDCSLGNFLDVVGLVLFFTGIGKMIT